MGLESWIYKPSNSLNVIVILYFQETFNIKCGVGGGDHGDKTYFQTDQSVIMSDNAFVGKLKFTAKIKVISFSRRIEMTSKVIYG